MSAAGVAEFLGYWEAEGQHYVRRGDYEWMAALVPGNKVLEIGCGVGFATQALAARGLSVLAIDSLPECLAVTTARLADSGRGRAVTLLQAEVSALTAEQRAQIEAFAPDVVVCWLMGAPADVTGATASDGGKAVVAYREKIHRLVVELAASLPTVNALHLVDRTVIPWQAKDIGRDTLVGYHAGKTLLDLPFGAERKNALYRKIDDNSPEIERIRKSHPSLKSAVPVLASLLAARK
jgi:SAM-dependent methyltransferase